MTNDLVKTDESEGIALVARAKDYMADSLSENTRRSYACDFFMFAAWCECSGFKSVPANPATLAAYFSAMADAGRKPSTIDRAKAAIKMAHESAGAVDPTNHKSVKLTLKGIRRAVGTAKAKKSPVLATDIRAMVECLPSGLIGVRDRALVLVGFAGAFRRSEVAGLTIEHVEETVEGIKVFLPRSKTDQEGQGRYVGIKRGQIPPLARSVPLPPGVRPQESPPGRSSAGWTGTAALWKLSRLRQSPLWSSVPQ